MSQYSIASSMAVCNRFWYKFNIPRSICKIYKTTTDQNATNHVLDIFNFKCIDVYIANSLILGGRM